MLPFLIGLLVYLLLGYWVVYAMDLYDHNQGNALESDENFVFSLLAWPLLLIHVTISALQSGALWRGIRSLIGCFGAWIRPSYLNRPNAALRNAAKQYKEARAEGASYDDGGAPYVGDDE